MSEFKTPLMHTPRKFPSILGKRVYDHAWRITFLNIMGGEVFSLNPYILHGPNPIDNGLSEIKECAAKTRAMNPNMKIHSVKIKYLGTV
jgi:hypothetical protein